MKWIREFFKIGRCCGDCINYDSCHKNSVEYLERNTLEHPSCNKFNGGE